MHNEYIKKIKDENNLDECIEVIQRSFSTVAEEFAECKFFFG